MKPIAIAFADIQFHDWKMYSEDHSRLMVTQSILRDISKRAKKHNIPVLFSGDLIDNPKNMDNYLFTCLLLWYDEYFQKPGIKLYAISGNHDMSEKNTFKHRSPTYLEGLTVFNTFNWLDFKSNLAPGFKVHGIPYLNGNDGFLEALEERRKELSDIVPNILLVHTDLPGAEEPDGRVVESHEVIPMRMKKFFKGFDLVLSGHIHKPQKLASNVYMLGAPYQQRTSDKKTEMGFWYIMEDLSMKFIPCNYMPKFIEIEEGKELPDNFNMYIQVPKKVERKEEEVLTFSNKAPKDKLVKKYLKVKGIKDKDKEKALITILNKSEQ